MCMPLSAGGPVKRRNPSTLFNTGAMLTRALTKKATILSKRQFSWRGLAMAAVLLPGAGAAQDTASPPVDSGAWPVQLEDIVVTGTRIRNLNLLAASPVTQIGGDELSFQGAVRVEDAVRSLPQVFSAQNAAVSNGATGTATLDLRDLGAERTLVLVNGRRLPAGSPLQGGVGTDINQIPGALIDRVEILTGGASATYGSDAVAGVVNFRLLEDFEGIRLDYQRGTYQHDNDDAGVQRIVRDAGYETADGPVSDGAVGNLSLLAGKSLAGGRGNVTAYVTWRDIDPVLQAERDYSSCALSNDLSQCQGSATQPRGTFSDFGVLEAAGLAGFDYKVEGDRFVPRQGATFNYGPSNYFQRPDRRRTAGVLAQYALDDEGTASAYGEVMFMDNRSVAQIAPSGAFFVTDTLGCGNPFLSGQQFEALCGRYGLTTDDVQSVHIGRRNVEGGNRANDLRHTSLRGVAGLRGDLTDRWRYDVHYQRARVGMDERYRNDLSIIRIGRALDAVTDPATGRTVCRSALDGTDPDCVPWNIFREGAVTREMTDYLTLDLSARGFTDQEILSGHVAGDLGNRGIASPFAATAPEVVVGGEYRAERLKYDPNEANRRGDGAGQGGASRPVSGGTRVREVFVEASLPLIEDMSFADEFIVNGAWRHSRYDYGKQADTYGVRAGWAIDAGIRLRASAQRAFRGPNVRERFQPLGFNLFRMKRDPCGGPVADGTTASGRTFEECARSGVTAAQFGSVAQSPANQYNFLQGGNPDLAPEISNTWSYGVVWSPPFLKGLDLSLDAWSIEIRKGIAALTPEFILSQCLDGNLAQCAKVNRGPAGDLWLGSDVADSGHVVSVLDNLAIEDVQGLDLTASWSLDVGAWGTLDLSDTLSVTTRWDRRELAEASTIRCRGKWGAECGSPKPDFRNSLRVTWLTPWSVRPSAMWRYISGVEDSVREAGFSPVDLGARHYIDLAAVWDYGERLSIRAGVNNLLDRSPPIAGGRAGPSNRGNGNTFPGLYDALGRYAFVGVSLKLD